MLYILTIFLKSWLFSIGRWVCERLGKPWKNTLKPAIFIDETFVDNENIKEWEVSLHFINDHLAAKKAAEPPVEAPKPPAPKPKPPTPGI